MSTQYTKYKVDQTLQETQPRDTETRWQVRWIEPSNGQFGG